jgi:ferredoxin
VSRAEDARRRQLRCPECGSREIACEREAILVTRVADLREGVLVLDGPAVLQPLDDVCLVCAQCAAELPGAAWSAERPLEVPRGEEPLTDAEALDALAAELNEPGDWNGADVCELAADLLRRTGRRVLDEPA